jgi:hypothetical protein
MDRPNTEDPRIGANTRTSVAVLFEYWKRRNNDGSCAPEMDSSHRGVDRHMRSFAESVDDLVACVHGGLRDDARDYETVNHLDRRLRSLERGKIP